MGNSPSGVKSDYRAERWATRVKYVQDNIGDWMKIGFVGGLLLVLVVVVIGGGVVLWLDGLGWVIMVIAAIPLACTGWHYLGEWSQKTLNKAARRRQEEESARLRSRG